MTAQAWFAALLPAMPDIRSAVIDASLYSPVAIFAAVAFAPVAVRIMHKLMAHPRLVPAELGDLDAFWGDSAIRSPVSSAVVAADLDKSVVDRLQRFLPPQSLPQGEDVAARARFVAMAFFAAAPGATPRAPAAPVWPSQTAAGGLHINCQPMRFTISPGHGALRYRLQLGNHGARPLGPLIIRAQLANVEPEIPQDQFSIFDPDDLPLCHYLDGLQVGGNAELTGEMRFSFPGVAAIRLGMAELLVPLMRIWIESAGNSRPALSHSACFAIGVPSASAETGFQPIQLDTGPEIWRVLTARRLEILKSGNHDQLPLDGGQAQR